MKAVLFDCDGVLMNTEDIAAEALRGILQGRGVALSQDEWAATIAGLPRGDALRVVAEKYKQQKGQDLEPGFVKEFLDECQRLEDTQLKVSKGLREFLQALRDHNIPYAVASNSMPANLTRKLQKAGLYNDFVPHIYSADQVAKGKPEPDLFIFAASQLGVTAPDCMVVEDSPVGIEAGARAGAYTVAYTGGYQQYPYSVARLKSAGAARVEPDMAGIAQHFLALAGLLPPPTVKPVQIPAPAPV